ncbi:FAD-binding oxidoreductase [Martelella mediterranea]|uniref:NAD(P)/FAD-dependent oxidoreductase n=1 Tax=Martelella mediterranea TaxID=293089 RepID=UPI001E2EB0B5|nr:FAD-dependent oxidoreductase [Martelella mediterranea]MCD1633895.1 FAD-binding oxidoreductase [Martelella mediterranea]
MNADVLVIGGGLHGLSAALHLARRKARVILAERHSLGRHASGATAAGVRTLGRDPRELSLSLEAAAIWPEMTALVGDDCGFKACGQLQVAEDETALARIAERIRRLSETGYHHEKLLDARELREIAPGIAGHCVGGAYAATDGSADPHRTIRAFRDACRAAGVDILEACPVTAMRRQDANWLVTTGQSEISAKTVINAAGAWADSVSALAGDPQHHEIRTSMMVVTERVGGTLKPVISSFGRKLSLKQTREGTLLIGGGAQGRLASDRQTASVDALSLGSAVGAACRLFPALGDIRVVRAWAGMEAMTRDHLPVIGLSRRVDGLVHGFGFSGHGFQLVPSVGRVLSDLALDGYSNHQLDAFAPDRAALERTAA